ncbi:glucosamine-6-phosphate deaminase [Halobacillus sp. H74]|uniref:glucosamine-6-phosphate deaminase n=1 Tax=Halobacillus sp. H74 TaxID=3457436 RepID=UPI003FCD4710
MEVIIVNDYEQLSQRACDIIVEQVHMNPESVLGLATGGTPLGTYRELVQANGNGKIDFTHVSTLNLDEYIGLDSSHPQSYRQFMKRELFDAINISETRTHIPDGRPDDLEEECRRYEALIEAIGPPDLQLLGIGENGHIGFNEPGSDMDGETHIVELTESTRAANARFFDKDEDVPAHAITMGIRSILKSKRILLLASGERKARAIKRLLQGEKDVNFPASALLAHPHVTLVMDQAAYGMKGETDAG